MRAYIIEEYRGDRWKTKVAKMSDLQVFAVYRRILASK